MRHHLMRQNETSVLESKANMVEPLAYKLSRKYGANLISSMYKKKLYLVNIRIRNFNKVCFNGNKSEPSIIKSVL